MCISRVGLCPPPVLYPVLDKHKIKNQLLGPTFQSSSHQLPNNCLLTSNIMRVLTAIVIVCIGLAAASLVDDVMLVRYPKYLQQLCYEILSNICLQIGKERLRG